MTCKRQGLLKSLLLLSDIKAKEEKEKQNKKKHSENLECVEQRSDAFLESGAGLPRSVAPALDGTLMRPCLVFCNYINY